MSRLRFAPLDMTWCLALLLLLLASCNGFLDELPDNRTELDAHGKIAQLLTSAYANGLFVLSAEMMSDNFDDFGNTYNSAGRLQEQLFHWEDVTDYGSSNESPKQVWESYYNAIAHANEALRAIEAQGNPPALDPQRGEALMCRAYHHFILVNLFCSHFSTQTGSIDLGVPYVETPETTTSPRYERGTVAGVYGKIERDMEAALPLLDDNAYTVPKYHFNRQAAFAFASRFYLYCGKFDKVIDCAAAVLGANPANALRDVEALAKLPSVDADVIANEYIKPEHAANLLLMTGLSETGAIFGMYAYGKRFMHSTSLLSEMEVIARGPWGNTKPYMPTFAADYGPFGFTTVGKLPYLFEYIDPVAGTGYPHTVVVALGADEALLNRAEAWVQMGDYDKATADIGLWVARHLQGAAAPNRRAIASFYQSVPYYMPGSPTVKKRLNPVPPLAAASGEQESFVHCLLHIRRIEHLFEGLRWFDIKRYGIEITRREIGANLSITETDALPAADPRRALQLPADVITAGLPPNPR
jgi:tetratricopeptide (TPR) repeat protein